MKYIPIFGLVAGGIVAAGQLTAAQWHAASVALLALTLAHGLIVLPWALAALFAWRYWYWKRRALFYDSMLGAEMDERRRLGAQLREKERELEKRPMPRKRATR